MSKPIFYETRVEGHIGSSWSSWFEGLTIHCEENGETVLTGPLADEAALYGVLMRIRDLGLPLLEVRRIPDREDRREHRPQETGGNQ